VGIVLLIEGCSRLAKSGNEREVKKKNPGGSDEKNGKFSKIYTEARKASIEMGEGLPRGHGRGAITHSGRTLPSITPKKPSPQSAFDLKRFKEKRHDETRKIAQAHARGGKKSAKKKGALARAAVFPQTGRRKR